MLFYFDMDDGERVVHDALGTELGSLEEAAAEALKVLPELARERVQDRGRAIQAVVRDERGQPVFRATLVVSGEWLS